MDRFLSSAVNRIDAKGRVSVPAHFRAVVQKRGYSELYALRCLD
ncbi:MAG: transcriptional regulator MraZ, partial [Mesorhizobium sp.]